MLDALKGLFTSKKFYMVVLGTVAVTVAQTLGLPEDTITAIAGFFGIGIAGIAAQDFGKEAAKLKSGE